MVAALIAEANPSLIARDRVQAILGPKDSPESVAEPAAEHQLKKAGVRLAELLNDALK